MLKRADFLKLLGTGAGYLACGGSVLGTREPDVPVVVPTSSLESPQETTPPKATIVQHPQKAHCVYQGPGFGNRIALTYDDGPTPRITDKILNDLAERNVKATFFMIGRKVLQNPSLAKEVADAGHELANHTFTHPTLNRLPNNRVFDELKKCQDAIGEVTGQDPVWFRPPYGAFRNGNQGPIARSHHLGVAYWSVDPRDWARPGARKITSHILNRTRPGSIILLHDLKRQTADATPAVLDGLLEKDFYFTPMSGFLGDPYGSYAEI
ncbi:MAG: polysaccharide deacetylase family protein [Verrucomicrobiota bacterium]